MSNVKNAREILIKKYGDECFIDKLKLRKEKVHYTGKAQKKKMQQLTYHHIKEKSKGGETTEYNGALLSVANHRWFNKQSEEAQAKMNKMFQDYKLGLITVDTKTGEISGKTYEADFTEFIEIQTHDIDKRKQKQREKQKERKQIEQGTFEYEDWKNQQKEIMDDVINELRY